MVGRAGSPLPAVKLMQRNPGGTTFARRAGDCRPHIHVVGFHWPGFLPAHGRASSNAKSVNFVREEATESDRGNYRIEHKEMAAKRRKKRKSFLWFCTAIRQNHAFPQRFFRAETQRRREENAGRFFLVFLCASAPLRETFPRHGFGCGGPRCAFCAFLRPF